MVFQNGWFLIKKILKPPTLACSLILYTATTEVTFQNFYGGQFSSPFPSLWLLTLHPNSEWRGGRWGMGGWGYNLASEHQL
jgi:hypothetical protein